MRRNLRGNSLSILKDADIHNKRNKTLRYRGTFVRIERVRYCRSSGWLLYMERDSEGGDRISERLRD